MRRVAVGVAGCGRAAQAIARLAAPAAADTTKAVRQPQTTPALPTRNDTAVPMVKELV
jgi:hypothetical protein